MRLIDLMSRLPVLQTPNKILKQKADEVKEITAEIKQQIFDMIETMKAENGAGLAANQIGVLNRVVITTNNKGEVIPLINPVIVKKSFSKATSEEGCLSVPETFVKIKRYKKIKVKALDQEGKNIEFWATGLFAVVIQHETDHLDGILITDKI